MNKPIQQVFNQYLRQYHLNNTFYSPSTYPKDVEKKMAHGYNRDKTFQFNKDVTFVSMSFGQSAGAMMFMKKETINFIEFTIDKIKQLVLYQQMYERN